MVFCLILGVVVLAISVIFAIKNRFNTTKCIASITLGVLFATFLFVLPTQWIKEGQVVENPTLYSILSSLLYSFKAINGRQDIAQLETIALSGIFKAIYIYVCYLFFAIAPILACGLVITFLGDTGEKIRYSLSFGTKHYVFSDMNSNSIELAKGIKSSGGRNTIVFCNFKKDNKDLLSEAKKLGAIVLSTSCKNLKLWFTDYEFFFISENEDSNIELTEDIIAKKEKLTKKNITVNAFAQSGTNIELVESLVLKQNCAIFEHIGKELINKAIDILHTAPNTKLVFFNAHNENELFSDFLQNYANELAICTFETYAKTWYETELNDSYKKYDIKLYFLSDEMDNEGNHKVKEKGLSYNGKRLVEEWLDEPLKIRFIDEIALFCNNLIFNHPLYDLPYNRKDISVLLIGCGRLGTQMLKTAIWYGQIDGYTIKIRVLDKDANKIKEEFYSLYPETKYYGIEFESTDINSTKFEKDIIKFSDATYVCIATGSDDLNISTADKVYSILKRNSNGYTPPIFTRIRKIIKSKNYADEGSFLLERNIHLFGTTSTMFSNQTLFNSQLETLAFAVHLCYSWAIDAKKDSFEYKKALYDFHTSEYSRRSSMAAALHIPAKLKSIGIETKNSLPTLEELKDFDKKLNIDQKKLPLTINEHDRWNAFMRSEGYRSVSFDVVEKYAPYTRTHKNLAVKVHPCIVEWSELDALQEKYNALQNKLYLKKSDFKEYDEKLVVEIPKIVKRANELCEEEW